MVSDEVGFASCDLDKAPIGLVAECRMIAETNLLDGRYLLLFWESTRGFEPQYNWEGQICEEFLGQPSLRGEFHNWLYSANGAIRGYTETNSPGLTIVWVLLRKLGPKPYLKSKELSQMELEASTLPVADPVFTRDVANNVWHTKDGNQKNVLIQRFASLCAWADEKILVMDHERQIRRPNAPLSLAKDPVPKALKEPYLFKSRDAGLELRT